MIYMKEIYLCSYITQKTKYAIYIYCGFGYIMFRVQNAVDYLKICCYSYIVTSGELQASTCNRWQNVMSACKRYTVLDEKDSFLQRYDK